MVPFLYLSIGAILGAGARYGICLWSPAVLSGSAAFPWATFFINVSGSLLLGFLARFLPAAASAPELRVMLMTGFCGSYTTLSTFSLDVVTLLQSKAYLTAGLYMAGTMTLGPAACICGFLLAGLLV